RARRVLLRQPHRYAAGRRRQRRRRHPSRRSLLPDQLSPRYGPAAARASVDDFRRPSLIRHFTRGVLFAAMLGAVSLGAEELRMTTLYRTGTFTKGAGRANLVVRDVVGDSRPEMISCHFGGAAFAMSYDGTTYR